MASIGRIQAALASATNEVTLAAANINFDFTLIKCEAPQEYHPLGNILSKKRKHDAESGSTHITARRLGALFQSVLPETPHLLTAYGTRVSEIAHDAKKNFQSETEDSIFFEHGGVDGTSIWAAATSSSSALHVQLLACMLARIWTASEATSVWVELVKQRRLQVGQRWEENEPLPYSTLSAATQSNISRESLAEWDASARAWLRTADKAKAKEQNQLMLLIANVNIPVNSDMVVYESVMSSWKSALESMEKLVTGMPQAVHSGPCLLALSAWHLFPDIMILGSTAQEHRFRDPLVHSGGILTLGLAPRQPDDRQGVFWSLSLAHLNYYGRPASRIGSLGTNSRKLTFVQFTHAVYGALLAYWGFYNDPSGPPAQLLVALRNAMRRLVYRGLPSKYHHMSYRLSDIVIRCSGQSTYEINKFLNDKSHGVNLLTETATDHVEHGGDKDDLTSNLISFGGRRASTFIGLQHASIPLFSDLRRIITLLKGPEERIALLRRLVLPENQPSFDQKVFIRYFVKDPAYTMPLCGLASAYHCVVTSSEPENGGVSHSRWTPISLRGLIRNQNERFDEMAIDDSFHIGRETSLFELQTPTLGFYSEPTVFSFLDGDPDLAGIFINESLLDESFIIKDISIDDVLWCFESDMFDMDEVAGFLTKTAYSELSPDIQTFRSLGKAHWVYRSLPEATITTAIMDRPLFSRRWMSEQLRYLNVPDPLSHQPLEGPISLAVSFSCVAYLDSGIDIPPEVMNDVFAIAFEDSIYFSMKVRPPFPSLQKSSFDLN